MFSLSLFFFFHIGHENSRQIYLIDLIVPNLNPKQWSDSLPSFSLKMIRFFYKYDFCVNIKIKYFIILNFQLLISINVCCSWIFKSFVSFKIMMIKYSRYNSCIYIIIIMIPSIISNHPFQQNLVTHKLSNVKLVISATFIENFVS